MLNQSQSWLKRIWQQVLGWTRHSKEVLPDLLNGHNHTNEFIVLGLGRFGTSVAMTLNAYDHDVLAIDSSEKRVQEMSHLLPHVIQLDVTNIDALQEVGADAFDTGIVCIGSNFEANVLATVNLRKLGVRRVLSKVRTLTQQDILLKVGADEVILPEHEAGVRLGRKLASVDFVDFMDLTPGTGIVEMIVPKKLIDQTLMQSQIGQRFGLMVVAIRRNDELIISPRAEEVLHKDDILIVLGQTSDCERLRVQMGGRVNNA